MAEKGTVSKIKRRQMEKTLAKGGRKGPQRTHKKKPVDVLKPENACFYRPSDNNVGSAKRARQRQWLMKQAMAIASAPQITMNTEIDKKSALALLNELEPRMTSSSPTAAAKLKTMLCAFIDTLISEKTLPSGPMRFRYAINLASATCRVSAPLRNYFEEQVNSVLAPQ